MKKKKLLPIIMSITMFSVTMFTGCAKDDTPSVYDPSSGSIGTNVESPVYQPKLDLIRIPAYNNVSALSLDAGSYLSYLGKESNTAYAKELEAGIKQAITDLNTKLGYTGSNAITYSYNGPKNSNNLNEQINILDVELARYPATMSIAPLDNNAYQTQFDLAQDNGIRLVAFDTASSQSNTAAVIGTDTTSAIEDAIQVLTTNMKTPGELVLLTNNATTPIMETLIPDLVTYLEGSAPDYTLSKVINVDDASLLYPEEISEDTDVESDATKEPTIEEPTIDMPILEEPTEGETTEERFSDEMASYETAQSVGYITIDSETCQKLLDYLDTKETTNHHIVSFDANDAQQAALRSGQIDALILRNPFAIGYATVVASVRATMSIGNQSYVDTGHTLITADNLDTKEIQDLLY